MRDTVFLVCGAFFCFSPVLGMMQDKVLKGCDESTMVWLTDVRCDRSDVLSSGSEATLSGDFSVFDLRDNQSSEFTKGRRRSRSEEILLPNPDFDSRQSYEFDSGRRRSRSDIVNDDEMSKLGILGEIELRRQREKLSDPIENINDVLKIYARQMSPYLEKDFFQRIKSSDTCVDKARVLMSGMISYINGREDRIRDIEKKNEELTEKIKDLTRKEKKREDYVRNLENRLVIADTCVDKARVLMSGMISCINGREDRIRDIEKKNEELTEKIKDLTRKEKKREDYVRNLENRLVIAENKESDFSSRGGASSGEKESGSLFYDHDLDINPNTSTFRVRKFEYVGDTNENKKQAHGKGMLSHIHGIVSVAGYFCHNYLDLSKAVEIKGHCGRRYKFKGNESFERRAMISVDDISRVNDVYSLDLSTICLKLSNDDGVNEYILFNPNFVYRGDLVGRNITGRGRMFGITGEVQEGEFEDGEYLCKK